MGNDDLILAIAIGTNSAAAQNSVEFALDKVKLATVNGTFSYNFSSFTTEINAVSSSLSSTNISLTSSINTVASNLSLEASRADTVEKQLSADINTLKSSVVYATGKASQNIDGSLNLGNVQLNNLNVFYTLDVKSNKIKNVAFGTDNNDAVAFKQLADEVARAQAAEATLTAKCNDLQSQLTVQAGYNTQIYNYLFGTAPSVVPTR